MRQMHDSNQQAEFAAPSDPVPSLSSLCVCACLVAQSCPTPPFCDLMDLALPGSSVHAILQARVLSGLPFLLQGLSFCKRYQNHSPSTAIEQWQLRDEREQVLEWEGGD